MTEPKAQSQEPTMEEILASIRRIISENDDPSAAAPAKAPAGKGAGARPTIADDGVLELTDMVSSDGKIVNIAEAKAVASVAPEPPAKKEPATMADPTPEPAAKANAEVSPDDVELSAPAEEASASPRPSDVEDMLMSSGTASASTSAFAALARELDRKSGSETLPNSVPIGSGRTLEDLVKEMIRPMLRDWLDANLPGMVERMVKREIERLVRRAED